MSPPPKGSALTLSELNVFGWKPVNDSLWKSYNLETIQTCNAQDHSGWYFLSRTHTQIQNLTKTPTPSKREWCCLLVVSMQLNYHYH